MMIRQMMLPAPTFPMRGGVAETRTQSPSQSSAPPPRPISQSPSPVPPFRLTGPSFIVVLYVRPHAFHNGSGSGSEAIVTFTLSPGSMRTSWPRSSVNAFSMRISLYM
jgi:hypothetical protein